MYFIRFVSLILLSYCIFTPEGMTYNSPSSDCSSFRKFSSRKHSLQKKVPFKVKGKSSIVKSKPKKIYKLKIQRPPKSPKPLRAPKINSKHRQVKAKLKALPKKSINSIAKKASPLQLNPSKIKSTPLPSQKNASSPRSFTPKPTVSAKIHPHYLQHLNNHTKNIVGIGQLNTLYSKNLFGQGQTIAVVEEAGAWSLMKDIVSGKTGKLSPYIRQNYKNNFLTQMTSAGINNNKASLVPHGPNVASIALDLAPSASILAVTTQVDLYDTAHALMDLAKNVNVKVINLSSLSFTFQFSGDSYFFPPKYVQALKTVIKAGKVVVIAAGNTGSEFRPTKANSNIKNAPQEKFIAHLLDHLDSETRQSVIFAGNLNPETCNLDKSSTYPGSFLSAQESFLCAPGTVRLSYEEEKRLPILGSSRWQYSYKLYAGTSYAAPYISATIANLLSLSPNIPPRQVVRALLETAKKRPDVSTYGCGIIQADSALQALSKHQYVY